MSYHIARSNSFMLPGLESYLFVDSTGIPPHVSLHMYSTCILHVSLHLYYSLHISFIYLIPQSDTSFHTSFTPHSQLIYTTPHSIPHSLLPHLTDSLHTSLTHSTCHSHLTPHLTQISLTKHM